VKRLLIANRGEIAIRVARAAADLGIPTVAVFSRDDARCLHVKKADEARELDGTGPAAYLDAEAIIALAREAGCDAIHPGYGFLAESAAFASRCAQAGIRFVGPSPAVLEQLGDKAKARGLAERCDVPTVPGISHATSVGEARDFLTAVGEGGAILLKALAGGGGRGMRVVRDVAALEESYERCRAEAAAAFGNGDLYVERWLDHVRHVEVQIIGDGHDVAALGERECTLQRRHQKLVEVAPSPSLSAPLRERLVAAATRMAAEIGYASLGTFEFLVEARAEGEPGFFFIEANPRLQVEHTVTEEMTGIDLVQAQLELAQGKRLGELDLHAAPARGFAIELRVNMETMEADGAAKPAGGTLIAFEPPSGAGLRVDTLAYAGYTTNPRFDSLLAKLVVRSRSSRFADAVDRARRAVMELRIEGVATNAAWLEALLEHPRVRANDVHTRFVEEHAAELAAAAHRRDGRRYFESSALAAASGIAGARIDSRDPLAVLHHGKSGAGQLARETAPPPAEPGAVRSHIQGTIVAIEARAGDVVRAGQPLLVMEAMKMQHVIGAPASGRVRRITVAIGDTVFEGHPLAFVEEREDVGSELQTAGEVDVERVRPDLSEVHERHALGLDAARPEAVARRRQTGQRTARENIDDLCDPGSFVEYGPVVIAAQRRRRSVEDLIRKTPADGLVAGIGTVNGDLFEPARAQAIAMSYDYMVLAGTQGTQNHRKKDRLFEIAEKQHLSVVFFTEGGGGRPGDTDGIGVAGLDCMAFTLWGRLSGLVPLIGVNSGRCFAGNAAILGCCDVVIATRQSSIGMGGPAMIEGGGLGVFHPDEVGPIGVQAANGVVDVEVVDDAEGVRVAKRYLSYFQGTLADWRCADQRLLRGIIPENRLRIYDVRRVIDTLADSGSVLELRRAFGLGMVTALARIEGRPLGIIANNPVHLAGAIDSNGADKAARFMQLCDAFDLPILFLCDTPGIMVGPEAEKTALVRHASRLFVTGSSMTVPFFTIVLRKGYGLGAQAMAGGSFKAGLFTVAWPTGEFGGMGLEGFVKLGYRNELAAVTDAAERKKLFDEMVARMYEHGKALNTASHFEIDDVIDPVDSRRWIMSALRGHPGSGRTRGKKRPCVDTW
jgi:acetyl/propionyl-CoA carboxylase alpha subunit/acetyl-CoA carboxylase carboxyltransferase component